MEEGKGEGRREGVRDPGGPDRRQGRKRIREKQKGRREGRREGLREREREREERERERERDICLVHPSTPFHLSHHPFSSLLSSLAAPVLGRYLCSARRFCDTLIPFSIELGRRFIPSSCLLHLFLNPLVLFLLLLLVLLLHLFLLVVLPRFCIPLLLSPTLLRSCLSTWLLLFFLLRDLPPSLPPSIPLFPMISLVCAMDPLSDGCSESLISPLSSSDGVGVASAVSVVVHLLILRCPLTLLFAVCSPPFVVS